eukprot:tig00001107_g7100.t1
MLRRVVLRSAAAVAAPAARRLIASAARPVAAVALRPAAHIIVPVRNFGGAASFLDRAQVTDRVITVIKNFQKVDPEKVTPNSHFINDLGLDSLDTVELVMSFEDEFCIEIPDQEAEKIHSVADAISYVASHPQAK